MQRHLERVRLGEPVTAAIPRASQEATRAMGAAGLGERTTVLDRASATPTRSFRYGSETAAPPASRPRRGRAVLFTLATILLAVVVAFVVVRAVQVPDVPTTEPPTTGAPTTEKPTTTATPLVQVPDVRGLRPNKATDILHRAGLEVARQNSPVTDQRQAFRVIDQAPRSGQVPKGTTVTIVVGVPTTND